MALSDYFNNATVSTRPDAGALTAQKLIGAASITVDTTAGWPTSPDSVHFVIYQVDASGSRVAGTQTEWKGTVTSATAIGSLTLKAGTDQVYPVGSKVICTPTAAWADDLITGLLASGMNQDGTQTPVVKTSINDVNGNEVIKTPATTSAVNEITVTNAATGSAPSISATGGDSAVHLNLRGKGLAKTVTIGAGATPIFPYDYVVSGCVWTGDSYGASLNASMTAGVVVINGNPVTVAAVTARAFTTNVDTYIDVLDNGDGTGLLVYTTAATNAASPALAANSIRIGIIQAAATITAATKVNQGQEDRVFPIASSVPYAVTDSLGNLICPRDPQRKILGYRQILTDFTTTSTTNVQITGLSCPVIVPTGRKISISVNTVFLSSTGGAATVRVSIWEGVVASGTQKGEADLVNAAASQGGGTIASATYTPSTASITINAGFRTSANTGLFAASSTAPAFIKVELV